ncbi:MAG TPA: 2-vinyl bacteriochlorophyllide hydratase [Acidisphaera sp.]|nr:2-vinyl bacteriochlorophyllide hydratase [Acidisphaera sp.]
MLTEKVLLHVLNSFDACPWGGMVGGGIAGVSSVRKTAARVAARRAQPLYTAEERRRRDESPWTTVQAILAPLQFAVFLVSLSCVLRYLDTGEGLALATASVVVKTFVLYTIMVTGSIWEHAVFGRYLFAPAFFWEDAVSMLVIALHTAYLAALLTGAFGPQVQMLIALAAYTAYVVNAAQFVLKLRAARRGETAWLEGVPHGMSLTE